MDSSRTSKFDPEQFKSAVLRAFDALWTTGLWTDEISDFLEQSTLCREKLLARALAQMQINISDVVESEPLTPPTKDMGVDPISLDTTTMGIADTLPEYHAGDNGLRERNLYSSDTKLLPSLLKDLLSHILLKVGYGILFRWTRQSLSIDCLVV